MSHRSNRRAAPRSLLCLWLLFFLADCSNVDNTTPPTNPDPFDPSEIQGILLEDELGILASESRAEVSGELGILVDESFDVTIRILTEDGAIDPVTLSEANLTAELEDYDPSILESSTRSSSSDSIVKLTGLSAGENSVRVVVRTGDTVVYTSATIPLRVEAPVDVLRYTLITEADPNFWFHGPVFLNLNEAIGPLQIEFLTQGGSAIPRRLLGRHSRLEWTVEDPKVLEVIQSKESPHEIELRGRQVGPTRIHLRLLRGDAAIFESADLTVDVFDPTGQGWSGFDSDQGPNGVVWDLATFEGDLIAAGEFDRVGGVVANGIARWNGSGWKPLGEGPGPVRWILVDKNHLVVSTATGGFFEWTGQDWNRVRGGAPGERGVLLAGKVTLAEDLPRWEPPDGRHRCEQNALLTEHAGALYMVLACDIRNPMPTSFAALEKLVDGEWSGVFAVHENPVGLSGVGIPYVGSHSGTLLFQWLRSVPGENVRGVEQLEAAGSVPVTRGVQLRGFSILDDNLYFVEPQTVRIHSTLGDRVIGVIDDGSRQSAIHDVESYEGMLFIAGEFSRVDDVETRNIAFWRPSD